MPGTAHKLRSGNRVGEWAYGKLRWKANRRMFSPVVGQRGWGGQKPDRLRDPGGLGTAGPTASGYDGRKAQERRRNPLMERLVGSGRVQLG
jgi:hypothetical protein